MSNLSKHLNNTEQLCVVEDGRLFLWGDISVGQLGLGNESHVLLPKELKLGQPLHWVSCGYRHTALVTGELLCFNTIHEHPSQRQIMTSVITKLKGIVCPL